MAHHRQHLERRQRKKSSALIPQIESGHRLCFTRGWVNSSLEMAIATPLIHCLRFAI
jgi:hypothetical protein